MTSMNNWLGFSLSHQELNSQTHHHHQDQESNNSVFNSDEISSGECFDSVIPSLNFPAPSSIFEGNFNKNITLSQDWNNMKEMGMNSFSCNNQNMQENQERPKLENFLGHSFNIDPSTNYHAINLQENTNNNNYNMYQQTEVSSNTNSNGTIGLSMIKNWLRNNPTAENKADEEVVQHQEKSQSLSLSMSTGPLLYGNALESCTSENGKMQQVESTPTTAAGATELSVVPKKSIDTFGQRTSIYRGVTRHRWTGRYEAHLWDNSCRREGQTRKGRQVYLGGYDKEEKAARAYDLAALKYWGTTTTTNFPTTNYEKEIEEMKNMTRQEYVASLRRKSSGFSRGASIYRGVTRHHQHGRWQARIGRVAGNKDLYLGTFSTQEEAAEAYDIAAIKFRGLNAVTNFEINRYDVKSILESSTLPIGGAAKRLKEAENAENMALELHRTNEASLNLHLNGYGGGTGWPTIAFQQSHQPLSMYSYGTHPRLWCKQEVQDPEASHSYNTNVHQPDIGSTQNLMQTSVLHNLMSLQDTSAMEHIAGSEFTIYGNGTNESFMVPIGTVNDQDHYGYQNSFANNEEGAFGSTDAYQQARNLYYQSYQSSPNSLPKAVGVFDQGPGCTNWIPNGVPTMATRANNFTVWNGT